MSTSEENPQGAKTKYDEFTISGSDLLQRVKELVHEGNVRRVFLKNSDGRTLLEIPLTAGVGVTAVAAVISPVLVAVGAVAAMLSNVTVGVERAVDEGEEEADESSSTPTSPEGRAPGELPEPQ